MTRSRTQLLPGPTMSGAAALGWGSRTDSRSSGPVEIGRARRRRSAVSAGARRSEDGGETGERVKGIEPSFRAWEARVLPLDDTRGRRHSTGLSPNHVGRSHCHTRQSLSDADGGWEMAGRLRAPGRRGDNAFVSYIDVTDRAIVLAGQLALDGDEMPAVGLQRCVERRGPPTTGFPNR